MLDEYDAARHSRLPVWRRGTGYYGISHHVGMSSSFALAWWAAATTLVGAIIAGQLLLDVREYTFDAMSRILTVRERWFGFVWRRPRLIGFADVSAVYLRSEESAYPVVVLQTGKKLYPLRAASVRTVHRYCAAVKRMTRVAASRPMNEDAAAERRED